MLYRQIPTETPLTSPFSFFALAPQRRVERFVVSRRPSKDTRRLLTPQFRQLFFVFFTQDTDFERTDRFLPFSCPWAFPFAFPAPRSYCPLVGPHTPCPPASLFLIPEHRAAETFTRIFFVGPMHRPPCCPVSATFVFPTPPCLSKPLTLCEKEIDVPVRLSLVCRLRLLLSSREHSYPRLPNS